MQSTAPCAQAGDEFVTELDVSELAPVELESGLDEDGEGNDDDDANIGDWSSAWQDEEKSQPGGQLRKALEGVAAVAGGAGDSGMGADS